MEREYTEAFRNILRRLNLEANCERYSAICVHPDTDKEKRVWQLCEKFWPRVYSDRDVDADKYVVNDSLDERMARKYIQEIETLLDELGWARL